MWTSAIHRPFSMFWRSGLGRPAWTNEACSVALANPVPTPCDIQVWLGSRPTAAERPLALETGCGVAGHVAGPRHRPLPPHVAGNIELGEIRSERTVREAKCPYDLRSSRAPTFDPFRMKHEPYEPADRTRPGL